MAETIFVKVIAGQACTTLIMFMSATATFCMLAKTVLSVKPMCSCLFNTCMATDSRLEKQICCNHIQSFADKCRFGNWSSDSYH